MNIFQAIISHRDLIWNLVARDLKIRYRGSVLGFMWTILNPLFMALIYILFLRLMNMRGIQLEDIVIGVFAWQFTVQCVNGGMQSITGNASLVKKVFFPRIILPLSVSVSNLINFLLTLLVQWALLTVLLGLKGAILGPGTLLTPLLGLYQLAFNFSLVLLVASANVFFRDTQYIVNLLLSAWFFMSPVMYPMSLVETVAQQHPWVGQLYLLNPLTVIITAYRALQLPDTVFPWSVASIIGLTWPLVLLCAAYVLFQRTQGKFSDIL